MDFKQAYEQMKEGDRIKLPDWNGYWKWEEDTIVIHYHDGTQMDIRESNDVENLFGFIFRDDWELFELPKEILEEKEVEQPSWWEEVNFCPEQPRVLRRGMRDGPTETVILRLQEDLNKVGASLKPDGDFGPATERAVREFQKRVGLVSDGVVGEKTISALQGHPFPGILQSSDIEWAARELNCEVAAIMAVSEVESRGRGFFNNGRPAILFERHWMRRRLAHYGIDYKPFMVKHPDIVNTKTGAYRGGVAEYSRLAVAETIDQTSAFESASWGAYQIMGFHWKALGYLSVQEYVERMHISEREHLDAFVRFIKIDNVLLKAIRELSWETFARRYNGPAQKGYDQRMRDAFNRHKEAGL